MPHLSKGKRRFFTRFDLGKILAHYKTIENRLPMAGIESKRIFFKRNNKLAIRLLFQYIRTVLSDEFGFLFSRIINKIRSFQCTIRWKPYPQQTGGESVGYQGRKSSNTTNCIFLCDNRGQMPSTGSSISGEHHDLYNIEETLEDILLIVSKLYKI
ncbi:hypothetical protein OWR28_14915 [Chryseobacterium sp. 1B4]